MKRLTAVYSVFKTFRKRESVATCSWYTVAPGTLSHRKYGWLTTSLESGAVSVGASGAAGAGVTPMSGTNDATAIAARTCLANRTFDHATLSPSALLARPLMPHRAIGATLRKLRA